MSRAESSPKGQLLYDGACRFGRGTVLALKALGGGRAFRPRPFQQAIVELERFGLTEAELVREMHLVGADGRVWRGLYALRELAKDSPLLWPFIPLLYIPGVAWLGVRAYRFIARHRKRDDVGLAPT